MGEELGGGRRLEGVGSAFGRGKYGLKALEGRVEVEGVSLKLADFRLVSVSSGFAFGLWQFSLLSGLADYAGYGDIGYQGRREGLDTHSFWDIAQICVGHGLYYEQSMV